MWCTWWSYECVHQIVESLTAFSARKQESPAANCSDTSHSRQWKIPWFAFTLKIWFGKTNKLVKGVKKSNNNLSRDNMIIEYLLDKIGALIFLENFMKIDYSSLSFMNGYFSCDN